MDSVGNRRKRKATNAYCVGEDRRGRIRLQGLRYQQSRDLRSSQRGRPVTLL